MGRKTGFTLKLAFFAAACLYTSPITYDVNNMPSQSFYTEMAESPYETRDITDGEKKLIAKYYGSDINIQNTKIYAYKTAHDERPADAGGTDEKSIRFFGADNYSADYSQETDAKKVNAFLFATHRLWQNSVGTQHSANIDSSTTYPLDFKIDYDDLGPYQQAAAFADYVTRFTHPSHSYFLGQAEYGVNNCKTHSYLADLIEPRFPILKWQRYFLEAPTTRYLTENEKKLTHELFAGQIDTSIICIHMSRIECSDRAAHASKHNLITYFANNDGAAQMDDFTNSDNAFVLGSFAHELTHIWQFQTARAHTNEHFVNEPDKYAYPIDNEKFLFAHYSVEQQAAIMEDYARVYIYGLESRQAKDTDGLRILVEKHFPHLQKVRQTHAQARIVPSVGI